MRWNLKCFLFGHRYVYKAVTGKRVKQYQPLTGETIDIQVLTYVNSPFLYSVWRAKSNGIRIRGEIMETNAIRKAIELIDDTDKFNYGIKEAALAELAEIDIVQRLLKGDIMLDKLPSNLPPGCTDRMIPGNRPEDTEWDDFHEWIDDIAGEYDIFDPWEFRDIILAALIGDEE